MTIGQGQGRSLAKTIAGRKALAILLAENVSSNTLGDEVYEMVKAVAPEIQVVMRNTATMDWIMTERGEMPYRVSLEPGGTDIMGRPYYLPKEHPLNTEWLSKNKAMKGADAVLVIGEIQSVEDAVLRRLRDGRQGGCAELEKDLSDSISKMNEFFSPYKEDVDKVLTKAFARHLQTALPFWKDEIAKTLETESSNKPVVRCLEAFGSFLESFETCLRQECGLGPEFHSSGGGIIAMADNAVLVPNDCPVEVKRDYRAELEDLASRSVSEVLSALDGDWTSDLIRSSALERLANGLKDICEPHHRRIGAQDLMTARADVAQFIAELNEVKPAARWELAQGQERVIGVGPVHVLARVKPLGHSPDVDAHQLLERIRRFDQCDKEGEKLMRAMLIDVGSSEVLFNGIFFKEELICNGMPPGSP
jgi:hypothetical protein